MTDEEIGECIDAGKIPLFHVPELLPLLLLGITDDCLDIATSVYEKLEGVGEIYKKIVDQLETRRLQEKEGDRDKTAEEGANVMEKELEKDRKCQDRYERELRDIEELPSSQSEADVGIRNLELSGEETKHENELGGNHLVQALEDVTQELEMAKSETSRAPEECVFNTEIESSQKTVDTNIKHAVQTGEKNCNTSELEGDENDQSQISWKEDDLTVGSLSAERILDADLRLFNECEKLRVYGLDESQPKVERGEVSGPAAQPETESNEENKMAGEKNSVHGLYVLTNELRQRDEDRKPETIVTSFQKDVQKGTSEITDEGAVRKDDGDAGVETLQLPKPYKGRPGAGCRLMVEAFLRPMIEPAVKELKQWTTPTRLSAARLLHTLLVLAEGFAKDNLDILVPAFCSAVQLGTMM